MPIPDITQVWSGRVCTSPYLTDPPPTSVDVGPSPLPHSPLSSLIFAILLAVYYSMALRPGPSYKPTGINWILSIYGANDASCKSDGTTSYSTMKSCIVPACSTSRTSFASEDCVSLDTSPDFDAMYQQTRSYKSAPRRGMVSDLHRSGDAPVADRRPPGPTRFAATRV